MNLIFPFISRCSIFSEQVFDSKIVPEINKVLKIQEFYGFTGLHAIKRAVLNLSNTDEPIRIFSIDRYFIGKGFKPQYLFGSSQTSESDTTKGTELSILILDVNKNLTKNIPVNMENFKWTKSISSHQK